MPWQPDYATTAEFKLEHGIGDAVDDAKIARVITAASRAVDRATNRQFGLVDVAEARVYTARWAQCRWVVPIDDLMTQAALTVATSGPSGGAITAFGLKPVNAAVEGKAWIRLVVDDDSTVKPTGAADEVTVTARYGWTTVPVTVKEATLLQASRFFKRKDAPFGVAGSPELGSEVRLLAKVDPDVAVMLRPYVRWDRKRYKG